MSPSTIACILLLLTSCSFNIPMPPSLPLQAPGPPGPRTPPILPLRLPLPALPVCRFLFVARADAEPGVAPLTDAVVLSVHDGPPAARIAALQQALQQHRLGLPLVRHLTIRMSAATSNYVSTVLFHHLEALVTLDQYETITIEYDQRYRDPYMHGCEAIDRMFSLWHIVPESWKVEANPTQL